MRVKVLLLKPNKTFALFSWIIRVFQKTKYSHMALAFEKDILDANIDGVQFTSVNEYRKKYLIVESFIVEADHSFTFTDVEEWAGGFRNARYSILQNVGLGLKQLGLIKTNPFGDGSGEIICSELVVLFLDRFITGLDLDHDQDHYDLLEAEKLVRRIADAR